MFRKRAAVTLSILVLSVATLFANSQSGLAQSQNQSVPNLSGTWELVEDDNPARKLKPTDAGFPRLTLVISQEASLIRITQKQITRGTETVQDYSYYMDGRGETNLGRLELYPRSVPKFASVSGWQKERLRIKYSTERGPDTWANRKDEWRLGSDGSTLILTISTVQSQSELSVGGQLEQQGPTQTSQGRTGLEERKLTFRRR
jgi:hypothetical protein